jgi:predicted transcriptional regulator
MDVRSNLAGPFVASLLSRNGQSQRWAAEQLGISHVALGQRLRGAGPGVALERLLDVARLAHASPEQLSFIADLDAVDRGALPLDEQITPQEVRAAREAIAEARK